MITCCVFRCFDRAKNVHAESCKKNKKRKTKISNAIVLDPTGLVPANTLYSDSYVKFDLGAGQDLNEVDIIKSM